jgi:nucleotide-binding universal stress UspA family protein
MDARGDLGSRILVPLDGSTLALQAPPYVRALATPNTEVRLLEVVPDPVPIGDPCGKISLAIDAIVQLSQQTARQDLAETAERVRRASPGLKIDHAVVRGDAAEQILRVARERDTTLIVMSSQGRGALRHPMLGSITDRVARSARVPVMIVRSADARHDGADVRIRRLIVPLDGSALAAQAVPVAERLARRLGVPICLITVVDIERATSPAVAGCVAQDEALYHELFGSIQAEAQQMLEQTGTRLMLAGVPTTWSMLMGPAAACIGESTCAGDLVVMSSRGQGGPTRWNLGSVAEKLVRDCPVPVIVLPANPPAELVVPAIGEVAGLASVASS